MISARTPSGRNDVTGYGGAVVNVLGAAISKLTNDTLACNSVPDSLGGAYNGSNASAL